MQKKCSIITVTLNNKAGLEETIRSVLGQTYRDIEYIIIDGASSDGSVAVIESNASDIDQWVSEPDTGVYNAMNKGIQKATGEYLLFLNSGDTLFETSTLEQIIPYLETADADLFYGDLRFDNGNQFEDFHYPDEVTFEFLYHRSLGHPATFIRSSLFETVGYYEESYPICADWVFFTKAISLYTCSYKHIPLIVANFTTDGLSSVDENQQKILEEREKALRGPFKFLTAPYEKYICLQKRMDALQRSKPYRFLKFLGLPKYK
ncbi:glycosyltransferase family 2 protein [Parapedobacter indicus]|uniref:Glycosyltransferase involved in cell wall bisynthesis n=1 Tax=Parapedobacter indicus TaxID=1477437 RepID=A0A1I3PNH3_9SPHI|nr:glycosyltransferase family 2 protein [Parapedobacter indicus]PPL00524.1 glycosyltransferase involved in cell wall biosynthesis [Parapedobacter indicus]SFJ23314.1 Glycosyltransferase involved in cell wall bisynthesis [Parapedobacter indicus]